LRHVGPRSIAYAVHRQRLVDYATRVVADRARAEDIVQDAFIRLDAVPADTEIADGFAFMRRIVRNLAIDWLRKVGSERRVVLPAGEYETVPQDAPGPERNVIDQQELEIVMQAMRDLPPRTRRALEMHRLEDRKLVEIAAELGVSVALAHKLVHDGLALCRERLEAGR